MEFFNCYEILDVEETAGLGAIKSAFQAKAMKYHPDRVPEHLKKKSEDIFKMISEAYEILSDPEKRKKYDEELKKIKPDQASSRGNSGSGPSLGVDKNYFKFENLKPHVFASDIFTVLNGGGDALIGTISADKPWVKLSETVINTSDYQEIEIIINTASLPPGFSDSAVIEIDTNGGKETVYVDISTEFLSNMDTIITLARSIASKRWFMPLFFTISLTFVVTLFLGNLISTYVRNLREEARTASSKPRQEADEVLRKFPPKSEDVRSDWHESVPQTTESKPWVEDVAIYQTLFSKRDPVGYAPVVRERRDAAGNVLERRVEYLRKEEMESILANEEQEIFYPKTGSFYPIKKSRYPEFYKKCDLDGDGAITLYELGETQYEFSRITAKYPEGDVDSVVSEFVK